MPPYGGHRARLNYPLRCRLTCYSTTTTTWPWTRQGWCRTEAEGPRKTSQGFGQVAARAAAVVEFQPEFSFMAYSTSSSLARGINQRLDLELEPSRSEQACLAVPPGHAIVDTGCASTLVGSESEHQWNEELSRQSGGPLQAERGPSDVKLKALMVRLGQATR